MSAYLPPDASKRRVREAENARNNRWEIVKALSHGQINRRDLIKWGLFTTAGLLLCKNGLSPYAKSAFAQVPTGVPRSPIGSALPFTHRLNRLNYVPPTPLTKLVQPNGEWEALWPSSGVSGGGQPSAKRLSWHTDFSAHPAGNTPANPFINPITKRGPMEGRPPGEWFGHQRWKEFFPQVGYALAFGECASGTKFHPAWPDQEANRMWPMYSFEGFGVKGHFPIPLLKGRYGEGIIMRAYNNLPVDRTNNGGFGRNEPSTHFHNAHNGAESDGASNAFHFPGTFYDYHWGTTLARHDEINRDASDRRASGPDGHGGLIQVPGDFRELQGTLWFHDHRFFFTAENVYKGMAAMMNYYSGPDRGNETLDDDVNLRLPSGSLLDYGNLDFDVNLFISDLGTDQDGQCRFDIFDTKGFIGDLLAVNHTWQPFMEVLPRKYRFRLINGSMSRFIKLCLAEQNGNLVPFQFIANDGNFTVRPITLTRLDEQGTAERYDIVVDFSRFQIGDKITLVNLLKQIDGAKPDVVLSVAQALAQWQSPDPLVDPAVGPVMQFRIVDEVESVDVPGHTHRSSDPDPSLVPSVLTEQIPIVAPVRERHISFRRDEEGDSRDPLTGKCIPDCPEEADFKWTISVNGVQPHSLNANRISLLIPKPGEVEHWTYQNTGGGWDHPIHLHFEEGVTINRGDDSIPETERLVRKDVWRLRPNGSVKFQVRFGEYGGAYVNHCHNTVHEDFAMLLRYQVLTDKDNPKSSNLHVDIIPTPIPSPDGCTYMTPEVLAEGNPLGNGVTVSAAPVIASAPLLAATVGVVYNYDVNATDANGDILTYSLDTAPVGMGINAATGQIAWTPTSGQVGANQVTVRVADPKSLFATQSFTINVTTGTPVKATVTITGDGLNGSGYFGTFDGQPHAATATVTGVGGVVLGQLTSSTTHTDAGVYNDTLTYTDGTGNYENASKVVKSYILKAPVTITGDGLNGSGYYGTYDGQPHAATATVTGVGGVVLGPLVSSTTHTDTGVYNDTVTYTDGTGNYKNASKVVKSYILKAPVTITGDGLNGSGYFGTYDGQPHAATAKVTGVGGVALGQLTSSTTHTDVGVYNDTVTFLGDANYKVASKVLKSYILAP